MYRVNDRVRKILDQTSKDAMKDSNKHSLIWGMFMSSILEASVFMGKNYSDNLHSYIPSKKTEENLSFRKLFEISEQLPRMQRFTYFQILCYVLERWIRTQHQIMLRNDIWIGSKIHHNTELWTQLTVSRWNSSGIFYQDSPHCSSAIKSKSSCLKWAIDQNLKDGSSSCRCSMTSFGDLKKKSKNAN